MKTYYRKKFLQTFLLILLAGAISTLAHSTQQLALAQSADPPTTNETTAEPTQELVSQTATPQPDLAVEIVELEATDRANGEPEATTDPVAAPEEAVESTPTPEEGTEPTATAPASDLPATEPAPLIIDYERPISEPALMFVENLGQFSASADGEPIRFQLNLGQAVLRLTDNALWLTLFEQAEVTGQLVDFRALSADESLALVPPSGVHLKLTFPDANPQARLEPFNRLESHVSYFSGSDPANWHRDVPVWAGVRYVELYPGLDLEITGQNGQLVQRLVVRQEAAGNAALDDVRLQVAGADALNLDKSGRLGLSSSAGQFDLPLLQPITPDGRPIDLSGRLAVLDGDTIVMPFAPANLAAAGNLASIAAVSDLLYSTYVGGSGGEDSQAMAVDGAGSVYITGMTNSTDFPATPGAFDPSLGGFFGMYVAKLNPDGSALEYATYMDGDSGELSYDIAVDGNGQAYVTGFTRSPDFPTTPGAYKTTVSGLTDAFVVKLNSSGTDLVYGTFVGGDFLEWGFGLSIDAAGSAYVAGLTTSANFPTTPGAFQPGPGGDAGFRDAFVFKLHPDGSDLVYSTYLAGSGNDGDEAQDVAVDSSGNAYVTGQTESTDFPTTPGAFQTSFHRAFVLKLNQTGSDLVYGTFLGGNGVDIGWGIAVDAAGQAYVVGDTTSNNFPTAPGAFQTSYHPGSIVTRDGDVFVVKFTADGSELVYGTYLGGSDHDNGFALDVDALGRVYVTGSTLSNDFPTTPDGFQLSRLGSDAFIAKLNAAGSDLSYGSFLGGSFSESGWGIAANDEGIVYVAGHTSSSDFPLTAGAFDTVNEPFQSDAFVTKLDTGNEPEPPPTATPTPVPAHTCAPTPLGDISVGSEPRGIAVDSERQRVYVANFGSNSVSVIDSSNNMVIATITGIDSANGIAYDPSHNMIWVSSYDSGQLLPVQANAEATSFNVGSAVDVGSGPWGVAYEPVHDFVYVANSLDNSVTVVSAASGMVVGTLSDSFNQPFHLAANPISGKVYVSNFGNARVTVLNGASIERTVELWDSGQPYGIAVDETRNLIYVATVAPHRIVVIGPIRGVPDQFYGWAAFHRGFGDPRRPVPLRVLAINPDIGPPGDGGHVWATTATIDGSQANQALFIPKGWGGYFHWPLVTDVNEKPTDGIAVDRLTDRVYVSSGLEAGIVSVIGDHAAPCIASFASTPVDQAGEGTLPAEQDAATSMDRIGVEIFESDTSLPIPEQPSGSTTVSGVVQLQGRSDHSGTRLFLSEESCETASQTAAAVAVTDAQGRFALEVATDNVSAYLCAVQPGYLAGERALPLPAGGRITLTAGDLTGDNQIDIADVVALAPGYGGNEASLDLNGDGRVDIIDLVLVTSNFNQRGPVGR